jgi:hypothetical protein
MTAAQRHACAAQWRADSARCARGLPVLVTVQFVQAELVLLATLPLQRRNVLVWLRFVVAVIALRCCFTWQRKTVLPDRLLLLRAYGVAPSGWLCCYVYGWFPRLF